MLQGRRGALVQLLNEHVADDADVARTLGEHEIVGTDQRKRRFNGVNFVGNGQAVTALFFHLDADQIGSDSRDGLFVGGVHGQQERLRHARD